MPRGKRTKPDDNLAPRIVKIVLQLGSGLLVFVGKPLTLILVSLLVLFVRIVNITGIFSSFKPEKKLKKTGVIYTAKKLKLALLRQKLNKKFQLYYQKYKDTLWKYQVFFIAFRKFIPKVAIFARQKTLEAVSRRKIRISFLKTRIFLYRLTFLLPRPTLPKISKLKLLTYFFALLFAWQAFGAFLFWNFILKDLPSPNALSERGLPVSTKIYDRNGELLYTIFEDENRTPVKLDDIPIQVRLATIAIEDSEFYEHVGFSVRGITRAIIQNLKSDELTGGSTITQQLVKNALLTHEKTLVRKLKEITLAIQVELNFSKNKILEMYLNEVSYGGTAYGIQSAARYYFDKDVAELTLAESAFLAGLPKSPTRFSPFGANPELAVSRQKEVLRQMENNGFITSDQRKSAEEKKITFAENKTHIKAPHFVFYVRENLEEKYGKEVVAQGGLEVITSLDLQIQGLAEQVVSQEVEKLAGLNVGNGAAVILNPQTGEILAMVGSRNYFDTQNDGNVNVATRPRQPGSSIKLINYAYALSNGLTAATIIPDSPATFLVEGQPPYSPQNYEGGFRGNLTLRSALAESRNVPAVRVLHSYGVDNMLEMGKKMGITTWNNPYDYGLSLTLGGGDVNLTDLARVYATVANYGFRPRLTSVLKVSDFNGKVLEELKCEEAEKPLIAEVAASISALTNPASTSQCQSESVLDPRVAFILTDILRDNSARSPAFGQNSLLNIPTHPEVAVKTGTSNDLRDNLAMGYTKDYVVAAWVGNNNNAPMARIASGVTGATPIFHNIMRALLTEKQSYEWPTPERLVQLPICPLTGTLACPGCPVKLEWFLEENKPTSACNPEWFIKEGEEDSEDENEAQTESQNLNPGDINNQYFQELLREQNKLRRGPRTRN